MHFTKIFELLSLTAAASATRVAYDTGYDEAGRSMSVVACSDGSNGLLSRFPTQGNLPVFPNVGGAAAIAGWNSPNCGTCWSLTYNGKTIYVLAIDHSGDGFTISEAALNDLTNGQAVDLGAIDATTAQVDKSICGL